MGKMAWRCSGFMMGFVLMMTGLISGPAFALESSYVGTGVQCPNDIDNISAADKVAGISWSTGGTIGPEDFDRNGNLAYDTFPNVVCRRVGVTDGYVKMADGQFYYIFGFVDLTGVPESEVVNYKSHAHMPAPTIEVGEGQSLYVTETNLSLFVRPDLFDPHTIHFHGFPHAMAIFDGVPENSVAIPGGNSFTYFYQTNDPGTYPYHCHVEPVEHIQMGMVGNIIVHPKPDLLNPTVKRAYDDGGSPNTQYDVVYDLLITELDPDKHWNLENIQEGANLWSEYYPGYYTINGRSYPDTVKSNDDTSMVIDFDTPALDRPSNDPTGLAVYPNGISTNPGYIAQRSSLVTAKKGDRVLIRINNMGYKTHTLTIPGIPMHIVGEDARLLKGSTGKDLSFSKTTYSMAGGKTVDMILDTAGLETGTYFLYGRELNTQNNLSRDERLAGVGSEIRGGMMTEIQIIP